MKRPCIDCDAPTVVRDLDEPAVCRSCAAARRAAEADQATDEQAGAQFVGRERGTRDDFKRPSLHEIIHRLMRASRKR
jgi:hypothetical protein